MFFFFSFTSISVFQVAKNNTLLKAHKQGYFKADNNLFLRCMF